MHEAGQWERLATRDRDAEALQRLKEAGVGADADGEAREQLRQRSLQVHAQFAARVGKDYYSGCMPRSRRPPSSVVRHETEDVADTRGEPPARAMGAPARGTPAWGHRLGTLLASAWRQRPS